MIEVQHLKSIGALRSKSNHLNPLDFNNWIPITPPECGVLTLFLMHFGTGQRIPSNSLINFDQRFPLLIQSGLGTLSTNSGFELFDLLNSIRNCPSSTCSLNSRIRSVQSAQFDHQRLTGILKAQDSKIRTLKLREFSGRTQLQKFEFQTVLFRTFEFQTVEF